MVEHQVDGRPGRERGELFHPFDGLEEEMGGAIAPRALECDEDAPIGPEVHAVLGERGGSNPVGATKSHDAYPHDRAACKIVQTPEPREW